MDPSIINKLYFTSIKDHNFLKTIDDHQHFYIVEINIDKRYDMIALLGNNPSFTHKSFTLKTSKSKDGVYTKTNGVIKIQKEFFHTELFLQTNVTTRGYSLQEESCDVKEQKWGDDDLTSDVREREGIKFNKETEEFLHVFESPDVTISFGAICKIKFKNTNYDFISSLVVQMITMIFTNYTFIMTKEEETYNRESPVFSKVRSMTNLFSFAYLTSKKESSSIIIPNFFYTLPCIRFSIDGLVFFLDMYDNLKTVGEGNVEPEQGFMNVVTNEFISTNSEYTFHYEVEDTDALLYQTKKGYFEIYTRPRNIYVDENKEYYTRKNLVAKPTVITQLFFTKKVMNAMRLQHIKETVKNFAVKRLVKNVCQDLDINYLQKLSQIYKTEIVKHAKQFPHNWLASFLTKFLTIEYNEEEPIIIPLHPPVSKITKYRKLDLEKELIAAKNEMDEFHKGDSKKVNYYNAVTKLLDQLKFFSSKEVQKRVHIGGSITNAWMKCWEMIHTFDLVPKEQFTIFCNAEFPGAFILALNHYIQTQSDEIPRKKQKYQWYANSLWPGDKKDTLKDSFGLYKKYPQNWLMNAENGGSVIDPKMIDIIEKRLQNKVDLYTSDVGNEDNEETEALLNLGQVICGLKTLKQGGTMVCKMILFFTPFNMSLLQVLTNLFDKFYVTKPMASRPASSEIYIVGKGYKKDQSVIDTLMSILVSWNSETIKSFIVPVKEDFYTQMAYALNVIYGRQIRFLKKNMDCVNALYAKTKDMRDVNVHTISKTCEKDEFELRKEMVEYWKKKFMPIENLPKEHDL